MAASDAPVVITPVAAPLSRAQSPLRGPRRGRWTATRHVWLFAAVLLALGAVALFVFVVLPDRVAAPSAQIDRSPTAPARPAPQGGAEDAATPPFRALELEQARQRAQQQLENFVAAQLTLEQELNVAAWGEAELATIKDRASAGDELFVAESYDEAMAEYAGAAADLEALVAKGRQLFDAAIAEGGDALAQRDHARAVAAFERAAAIRPEHPQAAAGTARAAKLPEVVRLLRESERAMLRGDHDAANGYLADVRSVDPATAGLDARVAEVAAARTAKRRAAILSEGFAALQRGAADAAVDIFDKVLREFPGDATAQAGRQQAKQASILANIDGLRERALAAMTAEEWEAALVAYDEALAIDRTLQFARLGKERVAAQVELIRAMERVIADPGRLSSEQEFAAAEDALAKAAAQTGAGDRFVARLARFRAVVQRAAVPVPLVLVSDNATEVMILKVGEVGVFERRELSLRPGRYVIVGSRDGCRDVRKEIVLAPDTAPVDIRCAEPI